MIYCVVPRELAGELYEDLTAYYRDEPNVQVIVDRRAGRDRRRGRGEADATQGRHGAERRTVRDRRRRGIPGSFPSTDVPE